jgi:FkbM family methyltransferase
MATEPLKYRKHKATNERNNDYFEKWDLNSLLSSRINDVPFILDVGAYTGTSLLRFKSIWPDSRVHCFEPTDEAFQFLKNVANPFDNTVNLHKRAISDFNGVDSFYIQGINQGLNSLIKRNVFAKDSLYISSIQTLTDIEKQAELSELNKEVLKVEVRTLDHVDQTFSFPTIDLLKVDVQGAESQVLKGARKVLKKRKIYWSRSRFMIFMSRKRLSSISRQLLVLTDFLFLHLPRFHIIP